jgi:drug/metabolite transporter (DMT)-like permease
MNLGVLLAILSGAFYGTLGFFGVSLLQEGYTLTNFLFWRFLFAVILLFPFLNVKQHWQGVFSKYGMVITVVSGIFYATAHTTPH